MSRRNGPVKLVIRTGHILVENLHAAAPGRHPTHASPALWKAEGGIKNYPWESPAAEKLIHACGYHRRDEELADARKSIPS